jgi:hypothetical protein
MLRTVLLQDRQRRPEVQVQGLAIDNERGNGFHPGGRGFGHTMLGGPKVNDLDIDPGRIEVAGDDAFGFDADRAAGVVEFGSSLHGKRFCRSSLASAGTGGLRADGMSLAHLGLLSQKAQFGE